ncbi:magnesium transporter protein 1 [Dichotomopilus funicola]|uniref:Magnesium transporter protein 1 n=1 Tax=Dichotomopilus funicola TaxID=1934379 RepID=A0AAN6UWR6_9PEZI|nr:magnesium transporter protein 1 [Dichotomopilus funicola]
MRWLSLFSLALSATGALAAKAPGKKTPEERFQLYHNKALSSSPVKLADASYRELTSTPRDYSVAVLLTAMDSRYGCQLCREFQPEWELLARSWTNGDRKGESRVVFGTLDFGDGRDVFMSLGLQTAPVLFFFPPSTGPHAAASSEPVRYDFSGGAQAADVVHNWLSKQLPDRPHPPIKRPINWMRWISTFVVLSGTLTACSVAWPYVLPVIQSRTVWAAITLISILLFTSGHMFNHIRNVPYVAGDGKGGISYFASGFQNQYGLETQIVAAMYGVLALSSISLAIKVPRMTDPRNQGIAFAAWFGVLFVVYSLLLSIFRGKNPGYTLSLPPFM